MKLLRFHVTNFRSVTDSGWIETDEVTALIGTNESGKTNILVPLWKLNPAKEGAIDFIADYPRKRYNEFRGLTPQPRFIEAVFEVEKDVATQLAATTGLPASELSEVTIGRSFDGSYTVNFHNAKPARVIEKKRALDFVSQAESELAGLTTLKGDEGLKPDMLQAVKTAKTALVDAREVGSAQLDHVLSALATVKIGDTPKSSTLVPRYQRISDEINAMGVWQERRG